LSYSCNSVAISEEARARGIFVSFTFVELAGPAVESGLRDAISRATNATKALASLEDLKDNQVVRAYRNFYWRLGIDPTKMRPSSEALARRALRGDFPSVSPLVDACNAASLETLVPIGLYDLDLAKPPLLVKLSEGGERFFPIGGREQVLPRGYPIMIDSAGVVVHIYAHRDSALTSIRQTTRRALVVGTGVPGVPSDLVDRAVLCTVELARLIGWGQKGPLCRA